MSEEFDGICPFCGESDFDLEGLKIHLVRGWCEPFEQLGRKPAPLPSHQSVDAGEE